jgi:hypothetical protein
VAEAALTSVLVIFWLTDGHIEMAWWCGALLGMSGMAEVLAFLGVIKPAEPRGADQSEEQAK